MAARDRSLPPDSWEQPEHTWTCSESAGNLADTIGDGVLRAVGAPKYQQSVTGWRRKKV